MRKQWLVAALGMVLLSTGGMGCKKNETSVAPPRGNVGQIETVENKSGTTPVNSASGAAATTPPKPATQPATQP